MTTRKKSTFILYILLLITNIIWARESDTTIHKVRDYYIGINVPFQGLGFYKDPNDKILIWNLTPFSFELPITKELGFRFSIYSVFSTPKPKQIKEFELNFEIPYYFKRKRTCDGLFGFYLGPVIMFQLNDQDTDANLGGPGITLGYKGQLNSKLWYRIGIYTAYHRYLWGPKDELLKITNGSNSGGLFMGLTLFELGIKL